MTLTQIEQDKKRTQEEIMKLANDKINDHNLQKALAKERRTSVMWEEKASDQVSIEDDDDPSESDNSESVDLSANSKQEAQVTGRSETLTSLAEKSNESQSFGSSK